MFYISIDICLFGIFFEVAVIFFYEMSKYTSEKLYTLGGVMKNKYVTFNLALFSDKWTCAHCKNVNLATVISCLNCGASAREYDCKF